MKNFRKVTAAAITGLLAVGVLPTTVFAAGTNPTFKQDLVLEEATQVTSDITVTYDVTPKNGAPAAINIPSVTFNSGTTLTDHKTSKDVTINVNIQKDGTETTAITKPGVYEYTVRATTTTDKATFTTGNSRTLKVVVGYNTTDGIPTSSTMEVLQAVFVNDTGTAKADGFTLEVGRDLDNVSLKLTKQVKGNLADIDHYFAFKITFKGTPNTQITNINYNQATKTLSETDLKNTELLPSDKNALNNNMLVQPESVDIGANGTGEIIVYLKHNQTVEFPQVPENVTYKIEELENKDNVEQPESYYDTTWSITGVDSGNGVDKSTGSENNSTGEIKIGRTADHATFVNSKNASVDTGIVTTIAPFATVMVLAALGYVAVKATKRED